MVVIIRQQSFTDPAHYNSALVNTLHAFVFPIMLTSLHESYTQINN